MKILDSRFRKMQKENCMDVMTFVKTRCEGYGNQITVKVTNNNDFVRLYNFAKSNGYPLTNSISEMKIAERIHDYPNVSWKFHFGKCRLIGFENYRTTFSIEGM